MSTAKKIFNAQKTKWFWVYIVVGAVLMIASIILMPFWKAVLPNLFFSGWGYAFVKLIIAVLLLLYLFGFLIKKTKGGNGVIKVLSIIEFVILLIIALGSVISQFNILPLSSCRILGLALWIRGVVEIFRAYYHQKGDNAKYPMYRLVIAILLISAGAFFLATGIIKDVDILWITTVSGFIFALIVFILGFMKKPSKTKK